MKQKQLACFSRVAREYLVLPTRKITVTRVVAIPLAFSRVSYEGLASNLRVSRVGFASKINPLLASSRILHVRVPSNLPATCTVKKTFVVIETKTTCMFFASCAGVLSSSNAQNYRHTRGCNTPRIFTRKLRGTRKQLASVSGGFCEQN